MNGFSELSRLDRSRNGGWVMINNRKSFSKAIGEFVLPTDVEGRFVEFNLRKCKWLQYGTYHTPQSSNIILIILINR